MNMKSKILGLLAVGLLAGPMVADAYQITIERISDAEALITGSGNLGALTPLSFAKFIFLLDPFAIDPAPATNQSVFDGSTMTVGGTAVNAAVVAGTNFAPLPVLVFGSTVSDLAPFSGFAGSLRVNLGGFGTLLGVGSTGLAVWGGDGSPDPSLIALWQIVAPSAAPEPGTLALMTLGLLGLGFTARRRLH